MDHPCGAVVSLLCGDAPGVLRGLDLLEERGMIAFFAPQDVVEAVRVQGLDVRGMRTHEFISIVVCCASHKRRHHRWPVYGAPMCRLTPQNSWI
jgi:hypothetical protein